VCARLSPCMSVGSMCVQMSVCLHVRLFYGKAFPCCLGLVYAGAILSCSRDCNEQLAAHQALTGTWFPREIAGTSVYVCGGCSLVLGNARAKLRRWGEAGAHWHCASCKWRSLAPAGKICSRPTALKPSSRPCQAQLLATNAYRPPMVPLLPLLCN
jgi:hypothetical protein